MRRFWYAENGPGGGNAAYELGSLLFRYRQKLPKVDKMKRLPFSLPIASRHPLTPVRRGFTLVEMLVVVAIIGILAGLVTAAAIRARVYAKNATIVMELKQLEAACQAYKEKFGEYPPDFAGIATPEGQAIITRHLAKAFPRYTGDWRAALSNLGIDYTTLTPQDALVFWLGGIPDATGMPSGFAADPTNPFQTPEVCPSRIGPFFDFDRNRLGVGQFRFRYWPQAAVGDRSSGAGAITYFRAENGGYGGKSAADPGGGVVWPAVDIRLGGLPNNAWINPKGVQIFSSGLDMKYGALDAPLQFPHGGNYRPETYDDVTNFSNGTLEAAMP